MKKTLQHLGGRGVIGTIVLIIIALILLGYFGISFKSIYNSQLVQENLRYAWELLVNAIQAVWEWIKSVAPLGTK